MVFLQNINGKLYILHTDTEHVNKIYPDIRLFFLPKHPIYNMENPFLPKYPIQLNIQFSDCKKFIFNFFFFMFISWLCLGAHKPWFRLD